MVFTKRNQLLEAVSVIYLYYPKEAHYSISKMLDINFYLYQTEPMAIITVKFAATKLNKLSYIGIMKCDKDFILYLYIK